MRTAIRAAPCNCDVISNYDLFTSKTASACFQGFPCITASVLLFFKKDRVHELSTSNTGLALCAYPCHRKNPLRQNFLYWVKQYWNGTIKISSITMHGVWQWTVCSAVSRVLCQIPFIDIPYLNVIVGFIALCLIGKLQFFAESASNFGFQHSF